MHHNCSKATTEQHLRSHGIFNVKLMVHSLPFIVELGCAVMAKKIIILTKSVNLRNLTM